MFSYSQRMIYESQSRTAQSATTYTGGFSSRRSDAGMTSDEDTDGSSTASEDEGEYDQALEHLDHEISGLEI